jgi:hypothetical protein
MMVPTKRERMAAYLNDGYGSSRYGLQPVVLDTSCVWTGLHFQKRNGVPPASVRAQAKGSVRLFMEYDTLVETNERLPRFAQQLDVSEAALRHALNESWLPHIHVVKVPDVWRPLDARAVAVRDLDPDDYPAAALAALLSPSMLLSHDLKAFGPLSLRSLRQGIDGVSAIEDLRVAEVALEGAGLIPAIPAWAASTGMRLATKRFGPGAWLVFALLALGGIYLYQRQTPERREHIKASTRAVGLGLLELYAAASERLDEARLRVYGCEVPSPEARTLTSTVLRELGRTTDSLSAQQLADRLPHAVRPSVADLRALLRAHDGETFRQVRRGGFVLGCRYSLGEVGSRPRLREEPR